MRMAYFLRTIEELEAELNLTCPVHAERRLARLLTGVVVDRKGHPIPNPKAGPTSRGI